MQPETREFLRKLSPTERKKFLAYLKDADNNIRSLEEAEEYSNPLSDNPFNINIVEALLDED